MAKHTTHVGLAVLVFHPQNCGSPILGVTPDGTFLHWTPLPNETEEALRARIASDPRCCPTDENPVTCTEAGCRNHLAGKPRTSPVTLDRGRVKYPVGYREPRSLTQLHAEWCASASSAPVKKRAPKPPTT